MRFDIRVYIEDTDMMGVVYHSNYLNFFERARTEWLRLNGLTLTDMAKDDTYFAVRHLMIDYKASVRLDDVLSIQTTAESKGFTQLVFFQKMYNQSSMLCAEATVIVVCLNEQWVAKKLPRHIFKESLK